MDKEFDVQAKSIEEAARKVAKAHSMRLVIVHRNLAEGTLFSYHFFRGQKHLGSVISYSYTMATRTYHLSVY